LYCWITAVSDTISLLISAPDFSSAAPSALVPMHYPRADLASCSNASISCKHQRDQRGVILTGRGNWGLLRAWVQTHWRVLPNRVPTSLSVSQILSVIFSSCLLKMTVNIRIVSQLHKSLVAKERVRIKFLLFPRVCNPYLCPK